jgi:hypothetical protein
MSRGDLHMHSSASDGHLAPSQVVRKVADSDMDFFSIADHNTLRGLPEALDALQGHDLEFIYGVEVSVQPSAERELHLLGYGFDPSHAILKDVCRRVSQAKKEQLREITRQMQAEGIDVHADELDLEDAPGYVGRPALADLLVRKGVVHSRNQAFARFLGEQAGTFVPMRRLKPAVAIDAIHKAGGLAVWAHPYFDDVDDYMAGLVEAGLDGIEAYRPALTGNEQLYVEMAGEHFGLFFTGGSDCHARTPADQPGWYSVERELLQGFFDALEARSATGVLRGREAAG